MSADQISRPDTAERFTKETVDHEMTVLHDDGLYRHLRFQRRIVLPDGKIRRSGIYWFDLITVPDSLIFRGDGESFVFARSEDMFDFFRGSAWQGRPNLSYWAEKVTSDQKTLKKYDEDLFVQLVKEHFIEAARYGGVPPGTGKALIERAEEYDLSFEVNARDFLDSFEYHGFRFNDTWEWDFRNYDWWFVWACHAILWGIAQYEAAKVGKPAKAPAVVDVELPAVAS